MSLKELMKTCLLRFALIASLFSYAHNASAHSTQAMTHSSWVVNHTPKVAQFFASYKAKELSGFRFTDFSFNQFQHHQDNKALNEILQPKGTPVTLVAKQFRQLKLLQDDDEISLGFIE